MATEFLRLYRDLTKQNIDKPVDDLFFNRERRMILTKFGHKVTNSPDRVKIPKHHGKTARLRQHEARQKALVSKNGEEIERMRNLREAMNEMEQQYELNRELRDLLVENKPIPNKLYRKLFGTSTGGGASGVTLVEDKITEKKRALQVIPRKPKANCVNDDGEVADAGATRLSVGAGNDGRGSSTNLWLPEEIERLNKIYWELIIPQPLPPPKSLKHSKKKKVQSETLSKSVPSTASGSVMGASAVHSSMASSCRLPSIQKPRVNKDETISAAELKLAWKNYYSTFAKRFRLFYPNRKEKDVIKKVNEYLRTHRFKEPGEAEYWTAVKN